MVSVWLIRHGESDANVGLTTADPQNINLTAKGHEQAKSLALSCSDAPSLIITSPFLRTKQTANPLIEKFTWSRETEWPIEEFTYLSPVRFQNTSIDQRRPASKEYWQRSDPLHVDGEGAESFADFMGRVQNFCGQLRRLREDFVVVFSHEKFIQGVLWNLLCTPPALTPQAMQAYRHFTDAFSVPNGSLIRLNIAGDEVYFSSIMTAHLSPDGMID